MPRPDLISAALRHARDATALATPGPEHSPDQAWHLAGFGPECAAKATFASGRFDKALGHELDPRLVEVVRALEPVARMATPPWPEALRGWRPDDRYRQTGHVIDSVATEAARAATAYVDMVVVGLWLDGGLGQVPR